jgi:hypothetical protein
MTAKTKGKIALLFLDDGPLILPIGLARRMTDRQLREALWLNLIELKEIYGEEIADLAPKSIRELTRAEMLDIVAKSGTVEVSEAAPRGALPDFIPPGNARGQGPRWRQVAARDQVRWLQDSRSPARWARSDAHTKGSRLDNPFPTDSGDFGRATCAQCLSRR